MAENLQRSGTYEASQNLLKNFFYVTVYIVEKWRFDVGGWAT